MKFKGIVQNISPFYQWAREGTKVPEEIEKRKIKPQQKPQQKTIATTDLKDEIFR